ncbi:hypothetical protein FB45DRAFT_58819 [Roridomyces roridus]|uniref:Mid2 domain-containing protein n=1 Tax=Roridomyces roridus TaxID=1738132 RepID=A0AAD7FMG8_9AGAR|nr:hypothetical protein FB45DRAFT_58819 [Roridomyces roridus]
MRDLTLLFLCFLVTISSCWAAQVNTTIDDASPLVAYHSGPVDRNLTGFDTSRLRDGTATGIQPSTNGDSQSIVISFTGHALYVFLAYPSGHAIPVAIGFTALIDGVARGGWAVDQTGALYNQLAYANRTMSEGPHTLVMQIPAGWALWFDYMIYTSGDPATSAQSSTATGVATPVNPQPVSGSSPAPAATSTNQPGSTPENSAPGSIPQSTPPGSTVLSTAAHVPGSSQSSAAIGALAAASGSDSNSGSSSATDPGLPPKITSPSDSSSPSSSNANAGHKSMSIGVIVGAALGGLVLVGAGIMMFCCIRRRRHQTGARQIQEQPYPFLVRDHDDDAAHSRWPSEKRALYTSSDSNSPSRAEVAEPLGSEARPILSVSIPAPGRRETQSTPAITGPATSAINSESAFMAMIHVVSQLTESVQRLEGTGTGTVEPPPPGYGD